MQPLIIKRYLGDVGGKLVFRKLNLEEVSIFCKQMNLVTSSGVSLIKGINIMKTMSENAYMNRVIDILYTNIIQGKSIGETFEEYNLFPKFAINMIRVGEKSGKLEKIFAELAEYYEYENRILQMIKQALTYPVILLITSFAVFSIMLSKVLPNLVSILNQFQINDLPFLTRLMIKISNSGSNLIFLFFALILIVLLLLKNSSEKVKYNLDFLLMKLPLYSSIKMKVLTSRICKSLYIQISSGLNVLEGFSQTEFLIDNLFIRNIFNELLYELQKGKSIGETVKKYKIFPRFFVELITIGEETGNLETTLFKLSYFYEKDAENRIMKLVGLIEPSLIIFLSLIVAVIVFSFLVPLFKIYNSLTIY